MSLPKKYAPVVSANLKQQPCALSSRQLQHLSFGKKHQARTPIALLPYKVGALTFAQALHPF